MTNRFNPLLQATGYVLVAIEDVTSPLIIIGSDRILLKILKIVDSIVIAASSLLYVFLILIINVSIQQHKYHFIHSVLTIARLRIQRLFGIFIKGF